MHEKSIDRELGELAALVRTLTEKVEALSQEIREYKISNNELSARDYKYLDDKINGVSSRVSAIEVSHKVESSGWWPKIKTKFVDVVTGAVSIGAIGAIAYIAIEWAKKQ